MSRKPATKGTYPFSLSGFSMAHQSSTTIGATAYPSVSSLAHWCCVIHSTRHIFADQSHSPFQASRTIEIVHRTLLPQLLLASDAVSGRYNPLWPRPATVTLVRELLAPSAPSQHSTSVHLVFRSRAWAARSPGRVSRSRRPLLRPAGRASE